METLYHLVVPIARVSFSPCRQLIHSSLSRPIIVSQQCNSSSHHCLNVHPFHRRLPARGNRSFRDLSISVARPSLICQASVPIMTESSVSTFISATVLVFSVSFSSASASLNECLVCSRLRPERLQGTALETLHLGRLLHVSETHQRGHLHGYLSADPPAAVVCRTSQVPVADQDDRVAMRRSRRATAQDTPGVSEWRYTDVPHQSGQGMQVQAIRSVAEQHGHEIQCSAEQSAARTDATQTEATAKEGQEKTEGRQERTTTAHRIIDGVVMYRHWTNDDYSCCCFRCRHVSPLKVGAPQQN